MNYGSSWKLQRTTQYSPDFVSEFCLPLYIGRNARRLRFDEAAHEKRTKDTGQLSCHGMVKHLN
jgi:hypothetical protein